MNCYCEGKRCKHLLNRDPWCKIHPKTYRSEPSLPAIMDGSICGDYEALDNIEDKDVILQRRNAQDSTLL